MVIDSLKIPHLANKQSFKLDWSEQTGFSVLVVKMWLISLLPFILKHVELIMENKGSYQC